MSRCLPSASLDCSGVVADALPAGAARARAALEAIPGVTVHAVGANGKIVATLETESAARSMELFERIRRLPELLSLAMVYHQFETDPDQEV